nr:hypothetical protein YSBCXYJI_YSBCXYJI_CDS_0057 [Caudoviricetes sp.]
MTKFSFVKNLFAVFFFFNNRSRLSFIYDLHLFFLKNIFKKCQQMQQGLTFVLATAIIKYC